MKYLITGGGTGGHIYPALAIIDFIENIDKESEILYLGTENSLESEIVKRAGYNFKSIDTKPMPRKFSKEILSSFIHNTKALFQTRKIIKNFKPDLAIGTGGYVTGSVILIAALMNIPTIIHEQNAYPGITNKILAKFVEKIFISFEEANKYFNNKNKTVLTGNPIREELLNIDKLKAYENFNLDPNKKTILIFGGSGGQKVLNDTVLDLLEDYPKDLQLIYATGKRFFNSFVNELEKRKINLENDIIIKEYLHNMGEALNISDLVIAPAGAMTLAEISMLELPSILIPKSYTAENHQYHNAMYFYNNKAALVIEEANLNADILLKNIKEIIYDETKLLKMSKAAKSLSNENTDSIIKSEITKLLNKDRNN